jgi:hypothetical protein
MDKTFFLKWIVLPQLRAWAQQLAAKDANDTGNDDRAARALLVAADEAEAFMNELAAKEVAYLRTITAEIKK